MTISATREAVLRQTADTLLTARRTASPIPDLPADLHPATEAEAFAVQDVMVEAYRPVGGYKVGARGPEHEPFFAPMPAAWMGENGALFRGENHRLRGVEAEICFRIGTSLPPRAVSYTREEVVAAVESCHPAIEILESAYVDPTSVSRECMLADLQMHGGFIYGPACADWKSIDFTRETVTLSIDGAVRVERTGSNTSGDLMRLLPYLANEGATRTGGLKAGQWITTGSWTGNTPAIPGAEAEANFAHVGRVTLRFA